MTRLLLVAGLLLACVVLVYRSYLYVDEHAASFVPLVMCLLFSVSLMLSALASIAGDGIFSGLRAPDRSP